MTGGEVTIAVAPIAVTRPVPRLSVLARSITEPPEGALSRPGGIASAVIRPAAVTLIDDAPMKMVPPACDEPGPPDSTGGAVPPMQLTLPGAPLPMVSRLPVAEPYARPGGPSVRVCAFVPTWPDDACPAELLTGVLAGKASLSAGP